MTDQRPLWSRQPDFDVICPPPVEPLEDDRPSRERVEEYIARLWKRGTAKRQEDK
jgi:hypothetical protein